MIRLRKSNGNVIDTESIHKGMNAESQSLFVIRDSERLTLPEWGGTP